MALLDIVTTSGQPVILAFARGNSGSVDDVVSNGNNEVALPSLGGACDYPSEDDVRLGTSFSIYTGNLELPAETDVLTGVQYGTSGTEFTGTATGGGGGGGVFIVNE